MLRLLLAVPIIALLLSALVGGHWYLAKRLILAPELAEATTRCLLVLLSACGTSLLLQPIGERLLPHRVARWIAWPASLWMGFAFYALLLTGASDLVWLVSKGAGWLPAEPSLEAARLRALIVVTGALIVGAQALRGGLAKPGLRCLEIALPRWPVGTPTLRIVQISDIHFGPILGRDFARWLVERVNAQQPDLIVVTGDLVDGGVARVATEVAPLSELRAKLGVYFVTGNHDHYSGARAWATHVETLGMRVLRNERVVVPLAGREGAALQLAGVDDHRSGMLPGEGGEDLEAALADRDPGLPLLLLAHDPTTFNRAAGMGVDLQLSGHTHGGQIWPFQYLVRLVTRYVAGHFREGDAQLYVSRGTGFWGPPMRLGAPAEITRIDVGPVADSPA